MGFIRKLFLKLLHNTGLWVLFSVVLNKIYAVKILSAKETFDWIQKGYSIIRFGDGELRLMLQVGDTGFQKRDSQLEKDLKEIYFSYCNLESNKNFILCLPGAFSCCKREYEMTKEASYWWFVFSYKYFRKLKSVFSVGRDKVFGEAFITRPFNSTQNVKFASEVFDEFKKTIRNKNILIIEGRLTRFGLGNDLLEEAKSVRRILGPEVDAYGRVEEIYRRAKSETCDILLIALGPAAKILAYKLTIKGFICIDVGHLDIEYEWYKVRAKEKICIPNKFVNESKERYIEDDFVDSDYVRQIIYECR